MTVDVSHDAMMTAQPQPPRMLTWHRLRLIAILILVPNLIVVIAHHMGAFSMFQDITLWFGMNLLLGLIALGLVAFDRFIIMPLKRMAQMVQSVLATMAEEATDKPKRSLLPIADLTGDVARFAALAQEYYQKHQQVSEALEDAKRMLVQMTLQQKALLSHTNREIAEQYQSVLSYANYLEEHINRQSTTPDLRYDFDDVCESSFNMKLIAGSLSLLNSAEAYPVGPVSIAYVMQQTMLALAPILDRRSMQLTTANVDETVIASTHPTIISQLFWMLLLGIVRYADDESTLKLGCHLSNDGKEVVVSIMVSDLAPGRLSEDERAAHFARQVRHSSPHLFAETIREHANLQVAEMLLARVLGRIHLLPISNHACEIQLIVPALALADAI
jgi:hypothetical protein